MNINDEFSLEWEERNDSIPYKVHFIAGSIAGIFEHILLLPLDNIKTHLQTISPNTKTAIKQIIDNYGISGFFRGSIFVISGCIPAHAFFFMSYEWYKNKLVKKNQIDIVGNLLVGGLSNLMHELIMTPCDMLKQRIQLIENVKYTNFVVDIYKKEGIKAFFRSLPINYLMNFPNSSIIVSVNENFKYLHKKYIGDLTLSSYFISAGLAGSIASVFTIPMDNIRTRLNVQVSYKSINKKEKNEFKGVFKESLISRNFIKIEYSHKLKYKNTFDSMNLIFKEEGIKGFFKGLTSKMFGQSISSGLSWTVYEITKKYLFNNKAK